MPLHLAPACGEGIMKEELRGTEVFYDLQGNGESRVLLLHGWGCDHTLMQPVADALADDHRLMLVDLPGHGESGRPPEPWGVPDYAACLKDLLVKKDFIPCAVVAHSFGCRVTTVLAAENPDLFSRIVFTGAAGIRPIPSEEAQKRSEKYRRIRNWLDTIKKNPVLKKPAEKAEEKLRQRFGSRDYNALDEEMRKTFVKVINQDLSDLYPQIRQSTLLIWGDEDTETPIWMGREMETRIPDAGLVILEGGSHFAYLEQIRRFNAIVAHFLKEENNV